MTQMQTFSHNMFGNLEVFIQNGKEYFPATDVAKVLGYTNPTKAVRDHCKEDGVTFRSVVIPEKNQTVEKKFINEPNLYRLIVKSKLPQAEQFEKWVFEEVLPSIRKHGAYMTPTINALLQDPDLLIGLASQLKHEQQARQMAEQKNLMLTTSRRKCIQDYIPRSNSSVKRYGNCFTNCSGLWVIGSTIK